ncbi:MAG: ThuA domain-containing protein [Fimbriimonadales bacterium]|nr:ThuA domain-containing protein [Fimbriimonadales bacterium]
MYALALLMAGMLTLAPAPQKEETRMLSGKKRLLVVTHTAGFRHGDSIELGEKILADIGARSGAFEVDYCRNAQEVQKMLTPDFLNAGKYDGVVFLNTTGDIGIPDLQAFLDWLKTGKAFIGIHAAADTYHNRPEYLEMLQGQFAYHGQQTKVEAKVEQPDHPAVAHLAPAWAVFDEIYIFKENNRKRVTVLLSLDRHPDDGTAQAGKEGDHLLAWCREYGKGRVFYTALGHRLDVWESEAYQRHLLGGIKWALRLQERGAVQF